jgi:hypothetical protein
MIIEKTKKIAPVGRSFPSVTHPSATTSNVNPTWHEASLGSVVAAPKATIHASYFFPSINLGSGTSH